MGTPAETKAASYMGPKAMATPTTGGNPGNGTVRVATSSVAVSSALDQQTLQDGRIVSLLGGRYVDIQNEDLVNPLEVAFSPASQALTYGQTATFAAGSAAAGWRIQPGQTISVIVPPDSLFFNHVQPGGAAASTVAVRCSEGIVKG